MSSPTNPPRVPITERITGLIPRGGSSTAGDPEERHTRNVTLVFVGLIAFAAVIVVAGLGYGFYDANLRPLANVDGTEIGRREYDDRVALDIYRLQRAEGGVRTSLAAGAIDLELAERRFEQIAAERQVPASQSLERLVDLTFQEQLAAAEGITLSEEELAVAIAADGTSPELRRISALVIRGAAEEIGQPATSEGRTEARLRAQDAVARIEAGETIADLAGEYSPATAPTDGDLGFVERGDFNDSDVAWSNAIWALEEGQTTGIVEGAGGELLVGTVTKIVPPRPDGGFLAGVDEAIGETAHSRNVQLEALAAKLEEHIAQETVELDFEQVQLAEILVSGDIFADPELDEGSIRASHILYAPGDLQAEPLPDDDPAWAEAQQEAELAADQLRAVEDPASRTIAFANRARNDSDGPSGPNGGDLGYFERAAMVTEFADAVFDDPELVQGDIVGPVRTEFGWHVIMFNDRKAPFAERLADVETALAADGADFATVAAEYSDGPDALLGGETGWQIVDQLDELTAISLGATEVGAFTDPVEGDEGYYIYLKQDESTGPLDETTAARLAASAFAEWYGVLRFEAQQEGRISIDQSVYAVAPPPRQRPVAPQVPMGGHPG